MDTGVPEIKIRLVLDLFRFGVCAFFVYKPIIKPVFLPLKRIKI